MGFIFELLLYIRPKSSFSMRNCFFASVCRNLLYEIVLDGCISCMNYDNELQPFSETNLQMMLATFHGGIYASV